MMPSSVTATKKKSPSSPTSSTSPTDPNMKASPRPLSLQSSGFSTLTAHRPPVSKSANNDDVANGESGEDTEGSGGCGGEGSGGGDLNREVAALSNKLISAINHQTKLDDSLSATRHELELSKARIRQLEAMTKQHADMMANGLLVERKDVESETKRLLSRLKEESIQRGQAEKDKRHIEQELENLTTALFDEANKMVEAARRERDAVDRKNEQLRAQLADTESLLVSHQEQLAELKAVMQQMQQEREETEASMSPCVPSTPRLGSRHSKESMGRIFEAMHLAPNSSNPDEMPPCPPTALMNLVHPVLRHDTASYREFCEVLCTVKPNEKTSSVSRLSGGSFTSIQVMGMGVGLAVASSGQSTTSSIGSSLFGMKRRTDSGSTTHSPSGSTGSTIDSQATIAALKETKFFKRAMMEDVEPTLRLDCAPGLSWLARRNVMSAVTDGTLVIDPMPTAVNVSMFACALCGESKADEHHARTHRMRTSDNPNAQRYPLCRYCTNRLRSACDFMAFLRTLKEGLWKCEGEGDQKHAWEESVKLRERLFWARIGGGVVPAFVRESRRDSMTNGQTETPPRTPILAGILDSDTKLSIPKKRRSDNPYLTPEREASPPLDLSLDDDDDNDDIEVEVENMSPVDIPLPLPPVNSPRSKSDAPMLASIKTDLAAATVAATEKSPTVPGGW